MSFIRTLLICPLLIIGFQLLGQVTEKNYKIYSVKSGKEVTLNDIAEDMKNYDVLFFGEEHNDSVAHYLENKIFEMLYQKFTNNITLSMEMFDRDVQTVMDEYLKGYIREKNFTKDARAWSNYKDYRPMVEFAKNNKLDIICANAPGRYTNLAGRKGQIILMELSYESKQYFAPLPYDTASGKYYEKLMALTSHNATSTNDTAVKKMPPIMPMGGFNLIMGQSLWDATMAYSISKYLKQNKGKKVLQVNGRFHSDEGFAIVSQLKKYSPKIKSLIISTGTDDSFPNIDWNKHKHLGDYIIITDPSVPKTFKE
nr:ChaN family lipoprotein [Bacteroidota bacterium]